MVKDSFGRVRDGFNIGFKFEPVNEALDLGFAPLSAVERTLQGVPALRGLEQKREVLTDILARYPGTKIAARADGMLKALPERDLEAEADDALSDALRIADLDAQDVALAKVLREFPGTRAAERAQRDRTFLRETRANDALDAALALTDPANRKAALEQIRRDFDDTRAARQAERELDRLKPKPKSRDEIAWERLIEALKVADVEARRPLLEAVLSEFEGTTAEKSAKSMLGRKEPRDSAHKQASVSKAQSTTQINSVHPLSNSKATKDGFVEFNPTEQWLRVDDVLFKNFQAGLSVNKIPGGQLGLKDGATLVAFDGKLSFSLNSIYISILRARKAKRSTIAITVLTNGERYKTFLQIK